MTQDARRSDLHFSGLRAQTARHGGTPAHEQHLPTAKAALMNVRSKPGQYTHQFESVGPGERNDEVNDSTMFHPLGNHHHG